MSDVLPFDPSPPREPRHFSVTLTEKLNVAQRVTQAGQPQQPKQEKENTNVGGDS